MALSQTVQELLYSIDDLLDHGIGDEQRLKEIRRSLDASLLQTAAQELKAATAEYIEAQQCLEEACEAMAEAASSLEASERFITKLAKAADALTKIA